MKLAKHGYSAVFGTDGMFIITGRNDVRIGCIKQRSGRWKAFDDRTVFDGKRIETKARDTPVEAFNELLERGGWHPSRSSLSDK